MYFLFKLFLCIYLFSLYNQSYMIDMNYFSMFFFVNFQCIKNESLLFTYTYIVECLC